MRDAWMEASAVRHLRTLTMKIACAAFVILIQASQCLASDDSPFKLTNRATGFCLVKTNNDCSDIRWTTSDRLLVPQRKKCLGAQGKSVGSEITLYECDENSELQKWECRNETVLALKDQEFYIELTADNTATLSKTVGPNNHLTISGTSDGACTRTFRELYAIGGNAAGMPCMFPFQYKDQWYSDCTLIDSSEKRLWCAVETKFQSERWGYCPLTSKEGWNIHPTTGAYYQLNTQSALTWHQAATSCKQQGASLLSITDPHEQAYIIALLGTGGSKFWTGLILDPEHGWTWSNGKPYRYMKWDSGHPLPNPGHNCANADPVVQYSWQSSPCSKKLGYICHSKVAEEQPTQAAEAGFCSDPSIPYNGHCFYLNRTQKSWSDAQRECRNGGGDLVSIHNVEDQSFVISQLGYTSTDELWIGLNDRKTEGLFDWTDHSTVSFTSWEFGKPAVSTDIQDCVLIRGEKGNWADRVCAEKHGYICMKSASNPTGDEVRQDVGCKTGWRRHGSYCYFIGTENKMFDDAKADCQRSNSYLADVSTGVDNAFLVSLVGLRSEKQFWIGLSNQRDTDEFVWTNTNLVKFTHWNTGMPGHRQGCVAMKTGIFAGLWDVLPCTNKEKYICKHLAEGASLTPPPPTTPSNRCADGWRTLGSRNYCSKPFQDMRVTWYEARDFCRAIGGDLISIHSVNEMYQLPYRGNFWIGLSAPNPATGFVWSDGSPVQFQYWADGQPNNKNNVQSCTEVVRLRLDMKSWNDVNCEKYNGLICQIQRGVTPKPPPKPARPSYNRTTDGWIEWKGNQYTVSRFQMDTEGARRYCQRQHSDLVTINSEAESVFLWKLISINQPIDRYQDYWIGLTVDLDRTYGWMDGSPVVFQKWDENQPRFLNNDEHCAVMTNSMGFWRAKNCGADQGYICKRSGSPLANATVAPTVSPRGGCPQNWKKIESKCYNIIYNQRETWDGARTQCKGMGGNLASITSKGVQVFLTVTMAEAPTTDLWIGLVSVNGNPFYWTDGRRMQYSNWDFQNHFMTHHFMHEHRYRNMFPEMEETELLLRQRWCGAMTTNTTDIAKWIKTSCNDTKGYICLRNVDPSLSDTPKPTTTNYIKLLNDSIRVVPDLMTWKAAKKHCEGDGAKLASLRNKWSKLYAEQLVLNLRSSLWIGMNTLETGGYYRYIDGWHLTTTNWASGEPRRENPCVYVDMFGKWRTGDCEQKYGSICMKSTDVPPTEPSNFPGFCPDDPDTINRRQRYSWLPFKGHCYLFVTERVDWPHSSANCARYGGTLASIEDPSEQDFIQRNVRIYEDGTNSFWIGLYKTQRGVWFWLDKTTVDYTNWIPSPDQYGSSSYAAIRSEDGKWISVNQWYNRGYVCKTPKVLLEVPPTTAATPAVDTQTGGHILLTVGLVITVIAIGAAIFLFVFKKSGHRLPIPKRSTTIDNPLFFNNDQSDRHQ